MSKYFTIEEFCLNKSDRLKALGANKSYHDNALHTLECLDTIRAAYGKPLVLTSGFRLGQPNASQHNRGQAVDIKCASEKMQNDLIKLIVKDGKFDQVIKEKQYNSDARWVHVSYSTSAKRNSRLQTTEANKPTGAVYSALSADVFK